MSTKSISTMKDSFYTTLKSLPTGYSIGQYSNKRYGTILSKSPDERRYKLYAEELGGRNHISFNLYILKNGLHILKPCEMTEQKVIDFVMKYKVSE